MNRIATTLCLALAGLCAPAFAADACRAQAAEKKLAGAAKSSFVKKCETDSCNVQADDKKLAGAARNSFVKKCVADLHSAVAAEAGPACEKEAETKKLAGAARNSFVKKCTADAAKG